jgi:hypothetical protein
VIIHAPEHLAKGRHPVRWHDPISAEDELMAQLLCASPRSAMRVLAAFRLAIGRARSIPQLVAELDELAVWLGGHGDGEACAALLNVCDAIRDEVAR